MGLTAKEVGDVLESIFGWRIEMNPHGFEWRTDDLVPRRVRLRCGSGIAGNGDQWALVSLPDGSPIASGLRTKKKLFRAVVEFMAGPPPMPATDLTKPRARVSMNPRTGKRTFGWYRRLKKRPTPRVVLVPFGAAQR